MDSGIVRHRASGNIDIGLLKRSAHWVYGRLLGRTVFLKGLLFALVSIAPQNLFIIPVLMMCA